MISIPLSILSSLVVLHFLGETLNTMTLGGLALAVGHPRRRFHGDDREHPSPAGRGRPARCLRRPCTVRRASRCRPWCRRSPSVAYSTSVLFLDGPAKYLFTAARAGGGSSRCWRPTGLSRTLTPIVIGLLLKNEHHGPVDPANRRLLRTFPMPASSGDSRRCATAIRALLRELVSHRLIIPVMMVLVLGLGAVMAAAGRPATFFSCHRWRADPAPRSRAPRPARGSRTPSASSSRWKTRSAT